MKLITKRLSLIGLLLTSPAFAADGLIINVPAVISSADFRPSTAAETPVSLTKIDKETIEARSAQHLEEVLNLAPNVNVSAGAISWSNTTKFAVLANVANLTHH